MSDQRNKSVDANALLREARGVIQNLYENGLWANGNTDPTGSIDEGEVLTGRYVTAILAKLDAYLSQAPAGGAPAPTPRRRRPLPECDCAEGECVWPEVINRVSCRKQAVARQHEAAAPPDQKDSMAVGRASAQTPGADSRSSPTPVPLTTEE